MYFMQTFTTCLINSSSNDFQAALVDLIRLATIEVMTNRFLLSVTLGQPSDPILLGMKERLVWL
jgi:hypothetical protein